MKMSFVVGGLLVAAGCVSTASAQTAPQRTTATYGNWTVRCEMSEGARACEMVQSITVQGQAAPLAQVAIGPKGEGDYRIVVQLPIAVWLPADVQLFAGDRQVLTAEYKRCFPQFCLAEAEMAEPAMQSLLGEGAAGSMTFQDAGQRTVKVPLTFDGLADAHAALTADEETAE